MAAVGTRRTSASCRLKRGAVAPFGCPWWPAGFQPAISCDPIFFHHTAILWTRLHGVLTAGRRIVDRHHRMTVDGKGRSQ